MPPTKLNLMRKMSDEVEKLFWERKRKISKVFVDFEAPRDKRWGFVHTMCCIRLLIRLQLEIDQLHALLLRIE